MPLKEISLEDEGREIAEDFIRSAKNNRDELLQSPICGCYQCINFFMVLKITKWVDDGQTALCPHCGIDSVVATCISGEVGEEMLKDIRKYAFSKSSVEDPGDGLTND